MMNIDTIKTSLADRNLQVVAKATGINPHTLYRLMQGKTKPNQATLKLIAAYLAQA